MCESHAIIRFFDLVNKRDLKRLEEVLTEGAEFYFPKTRPLQGRNQITRFFTILFRQYPELEFRIHRKIFQGSMAAVHWTNRGVNRRGEIYENEGATIIEMEGDKISFISDFFKDTAKF